VKTSSQLALIVVQILIAGQHGSRLTERHKQYTVLPDRALEASKSN
jgi:hypothetical protein